MMLFLREILTPQAIGKIFGHDGIPHFPNVTKFVVFCSTSYKDFTRTFLTSVRLPTFYPVLFFHCKTFSHCFHAPSRHSSIILHFLSSSTLARTSSWIRFCLCSPWLCNYGYKWCSPDKATYCHLTSESLLP